MAMSRWDPFHVLSRLDRDFDELVRRTWGTPERTFMGYVPAVDMKTDGSDVCIRIELPGVDVQRDVDIEVNEGRLIVRGERRHEEETERGRLLVRELRYGSFERDFALPQGVTSDDIEAHYDQGILEIRVRNVAKPVSEPKKVQIRSGASGQQPTIGGSGESRS
jgi:HSP20 family protein